ncbi:MAG: DUF6088 family protein [Pseudomonadota bacterium]|nr:DUF6088 family protein [Pseudomonadota bacterium]
MARRKVTIKNRIRRAIDRQKGEVIFPSDFRSFGSSSQVSRALRILIEEGRIVRLGYGVYAKSRPSSLSGIPVPRVTLPELTKEVLEKWRIPVRLGRAQSAYAEGRTNQVPVHTAFYTGKRRITRKITVGKRTVIFENDFNSKKRDF